MSKVKSAIITAILVLAIAVAAFFAVISFPVENNFKRLNSIASNIHLGADLSGYAYTTVYPEGVISAEEFENRKYEEKEEEDDADYQPVGGFYYDANKYENLAELKAKVASDAESLNKRFGQKGYSSYTVAVEDGVSIKISVPTNYTYAEYKGYDSDSLSSAFSTANSALSSLTAYGELTLRTTETSLSLSNGTYDPTERGNDEWVDIAKVDGAKTYSLADKYKYKDETEADYFKSITSSTIGGVSRITFNFTDLGRTRFKEITTRAYEKTIYFCVGDRVLINFSCTGVVNEKSLVLQASDASFAENAAITMNSAVNGGALQLHYRDYQNALTTKAAGGENAALLLFIASIVVLAGLCVFMIVKYRRLGGVVSMIAVAFALVIIYALNLLNIQVTFAVIFTAIMLLGLFMVSNAIVFTETKRMTESGRTMQASVKDAYKKVLMTVTDMHIVLLVVSILLAAVGVGEVAACGFISVVGVIASYVLYWFTRFMWYALSSPVKDKFRFAGLKRVVYEDD
ncbi:MAG: hypothetical protein NC033_04655 [Clostridiales bacterium]|nr:hypothetical protein [Clostridiales bacterium]